MRIAIVQGLYPLSGAGAVARDLARGLAGRHEVHFLHCGSEDTEYEQGGHRVRVFALHDSNARWRTYLNPPILRALDTELARLRPDVVNFHVVAGNSFSLLSLLEARRHRSLWTLHDMWALCVKSYPEPFTWRGYRYGCLLCRRWPGISIVNKALKELVYLLSPMDVVTPSRWLAQALQSSTLGRLRRVHVVPNGIDHRVFKRREAAREELGANPRERVVLFVGGMYSERKGLGHLVEALAGCQPVSLWVLGACPENDFPGFVRFLGPIAREQTPLYYSAADLLALPSLVDNCPLAVIEAGSCECPTVAYAAGGVRELVEDGSTGVLVSVGDRAALGQAIASLLAEPERRQEMGRAARRLVEDRYTLEGFVQKMETLFGAG